MEGVACRGETASIETRKHFQKAIFIGGLRDDIRTGVLNDKDARQTLVSAKKGAQTREYVEISKRRTLTGTSVSAMKEMEDEIDQIGQEEEEEADDEYGEDEIALINRYRARIGKRPFRRGGARGRGGAPVRFTGKCYNCDKPGHRSADCRQPRRSGIRAVDEDPAGRDDREERLSMIAPLKNW
jgi:uncharacterized protein (UPF0305 family)